MESIEREFVSYEIAVQMKKLGFKDICFGYYNNYPARSNNPRGLVIGKEIYGVFQDHNEETEGDDLVCSAPTYSQCFRFFREKQAIEGFIHKAIEGTYYFVIKRLGNNESNMYEFITNAPKNVDTFEEAELACLDKLIEIVETKLE